MVGATGPRTESSAPTCWAASTLWHNPCACALRHPFDFQRDRICGPHMLEHHACTPTAIVALGNDTRLPGGRCGDRAALPGRHDRVAGAVHDRRRHLHARELVGERVAIAKQRPDGQEWIVDPSDRREVDERRAKDESGRWVLGRELAHHRRAKALAVVQEARRRYLGLFGQKPVGRANIAGEPLLARSPRVATLAAVVEQQHRQTRARQRARQRRSQRPVCRRFHLPPAPPRHAQARRPRPATRPAPSRRPSAASPPVRRRRPPPPAAAAPGRESR
jgi:hypothetical protein